MDEALAVLTESDLADCGVVLEANLADVSTLSVGKVTVDRLTVSYVGTQAETPDNEGRHVYGGSDLTVIRGGWEALDRLDVEPNARQAIAQAIAYAARRSSSRRAPTISESKFCEVCCPRCNSVA